MSRSNKYFALSILIACLTGSTLLAQDSTSSITFRNTTWGMNQEQVEALHDSWERIELLFPMHTWAEQSADRVAISKDLVDRLYLGGTPGYRNNIYPTHSVSWEGFSPNFAAWVLETTPKKLTILAYNFEKQPQSGRLRVWRLEPGTYAITVGPDADEHLQCQIFANTHTISPSQVRYKAIQRIMSHRRKPCTTSCTATITSSTSLSVIRG